MIISLETEIKKRKSTPQQEEAIKVLENAIKDIEEKGALECVVAYNRPNEYVHFCNTGNVVSFVGLLELTKRNISDGF